MVASDLFTVKSSPGGDLVSLADIVFQQYMDAITFVGYEKVGGDRDVIVAKFGTNGVKKWGYRYDCTLGDEVLLTLIDTCDGGFVVTYTGYWPTDTPAAFRLNSEGNIVWSKMYSFGSDSYAWKSVPTPDCNLVMTLYVLGSHYDPVVMKISSSSGEVLWSYEISDGGVNSDLRGVFGMKEAFVFVGHCWSVFSFRGILLGSLYYNGSLAWIRCYGSDSEDSSGHEVFEYGDNNFVVGGSNMVAMVHRNGSIVWWIQISGLGEVYDFLEMENGNILVVGKGDPHDMVFVSLSKEGRVIWSKKTSGFLSTGGRDFAGQVTLLSDYSIAIVGSLDFDSSANPWFLSIMDRDGSFCTEAYQSLSETDYLPTNGASWVELNYTMSERYPNSVSNITMTEYTLTGSLVYEDQCLHCSGRYSFNEKVCGGNLTGTCELDGNCSCVEGIGYVYSIMNNSCEVLECFGYNFSSSHVCGGRNGTCSFIDTCICFEGYLGLDCSVWGCYGYRWNESDYVCSGFGSCISPSFCECDPFYNISADCSDYECYGVDSKSNDVVCGGHGVCTAHDDCQCFSNYSLEDCSLFVGKCYGIRFNDSSVCNSHGNCTSFNNCTCYEFYNDTECTSFFCNGIEKDASEVCSNHGTCLSHDVCYCPNPVYGGKFCHEWGCYNESWLDIDKVCFGHGICYSKDVCICQFGYESSTTKYGPCDYWYCNGVGKDQSGSVCSGRGSCTSPEFCECVDDFEGKTCQTWSCGVDYKLDVTCNGNGKCRAPKKCDCNFGFTGKFCDENLLYLTVMAPVLSLSGIGAIGFLLVVFGLICCLAGAVCCLGVIICLMLSCGILFVVFKQSTGLKKFRRLKNFELLLKEQQLDNDTSIAHLRINEKLFEIPFEEIKTECILGEGGSQSIVFKALWRGRTVAFKCFKTRTVCSDQEKFDEFEREVQILSSLSHPNVIRFFGATMNPPRVGIVMEFCSNGEFGDFIEEFRKKNGDGYPIEGKFRILHEVCSAMEYLHSRNIIHRDIKTENVLIDELEHAKLMDFGLSKLVDRMSVKKTKRVGTGIYMAPEVINEGNYTEKCDVFSMGIMMYIIITENLHPYGKNEFKLEFKVAGDPSYRPNLEELEKELSDDDEWIVDVIDKCWAHESEERYSFQELGELFKAESEMKGKNIDKNVRSSLVVKSSGIGGKLMKKKFATLEEAESEVITLKGRLQFALDGNEKLTEDFEERISKQKEDFERRMEIQKEEIERLLLVVEGMENQKLKTENEDFKKKI